MKPCFLGPYKVNVYPEIRVFYFTVFVIASVQVVKLQNYPIIFI